MLKVDHMWRTIEKQDALIRTNEVGKATTRQVLSDLYTYRDEMVRHTLKLPGGESTVRAWIAAGWIPEKDYR